MIFSATQVDMIVKLHARSTGKLFASSITYQLWRHTYVLNNLIIRESRSFAAFFTGVKKAAYDLDRLIIRLMLG